MQTEQIEQRGAQAELNKPVADQPIETVARKNEGNPRCCGKNCGSCPCRGLEHSHKYYSHAVLKENEEETAVLLGFGFVFAKSQTALGMLLRESLAKIQNSSLPHGYSISSNALCKRARAMA